MTNRIIIGCDHAGLELKNAIKEYLISQGKNITDIGVYEKKSVDYPIIAKEVAQKIAQKEFDKGILICGTGIGMSMMANRIKGIRAAVVSDTCSAKMSRSHNDSNILCLGERIIGVELAKDIVNIWLSTEFSKDRHQHRIEMFDC